MGPQEQQVRRFAWAIAALVFCGSVVNYMDRTVLGVVMPQIRADLGLSNADYGLAVNAFLVCYAVFYVLGGRVADWLGYRRMFVVTVLFWSAANMAHAAARGILSLGLFRALLGVGEGGYYPTAIRAIAHWFAPRDRAKAVGLMLCGLSVGTLITPPIVAAITLRYGWRTAFLVTGAAGALLVPPWLWLHRRIRRAGGPAQPAFESEQAHRGPEEIPVREVLRHRKYLCTLAARAMTDSAWFFYLFWLPGYFQQVRGFDLKMVGLTLWIPYLAADIGALAGAWASSGLIRRGHSVNFSRKAILVPSAALASLGTLTYFAGSPYLGLAIVSLAMFGHLSWASNIHTVITEITPPRHVATLYGITGATGTMLGAITQPVIGYLVDVSGYAEAFLYAGGAYFAAIALALSAGRVEPIRAAGPRAR
jgi:ACS family hexuronate transporter-like MFS transporter